MVSHMVAHISPKKRLELPRQILLEIRMFSIIKIRIEEISLRKNI